MIPKMGDRVRITDLIDPGLVSDGHVQVGKVYLVQSIESERTYKGHRGYGIQIATDRKSTTVIYPGEYELVKLRQRNLPSWF